MFFNHDCKYKIILRSNIIQYDDMGYPLRLCIHLCEKCGKIEQVWIDTTEQDGDSILRWTKSNN